MISTKEVSDDFFKVFFTVDPEHFYYVDCPSRSAVKVYVPDIKHKQRTGNELQFLVDYDRDEIRKKAGIDWHVLHADIPESTLKEYALNNMDKWIRHDG